MSPRAGILQFTFSLASLRRSFEGGGGDDAARAERSRSPSLLISSNVNFRVSWRGGADMKRGAWCLCGSLLAAEGCYCNLVCFSLHSRFPPPPPPSLPGLSLSSLILPAFISNASSHDSILSTCPPPHLSRGSSSSVPSKFDSGWRGARACAQDFLRQTFASHCMTGHPRPRSLSLSFLAIM